MTYKLGIDTGGTYTDAVLIDNTNQIIASAKSLTTRHDLAAGIASAIDQLEHSELSDISMVSLSTTLATNAIVEGYGSKICVILAGYNDKQLQKSQIPEVLDSSPCVMIKGSHSTVGVENHPLDLEAAREAILKYRDEVSAFAISGYFSVRNPAHEMQLRDLVTELTHKPVTCGHELASALDAPRRALTVALNARLITYIHDLLHAVKRVLNTHKIEAPMMVVKGDGSLMNADTAITKPVETILSGPAASVIGACFLSGKQNAIVADMGGTTTDVAVVTNGRVETSQEGAAIGSWRPMTEAIKVYSIGLGGDSEVHFKAGHGLAIGPRRVVPISLLTHQYPETIEALARHYKDAPSPRHNRFALRFQHDPVLLNQMTENEAIVWEMLGKGPIELEQIVQKDRILSRTIAKMSRSGLVIYSGFTPSDAAHVMGLTEHWCREGAEIAAKVWVRQMRYIYGYGKWQLDDAISPCESIMQQVSEKISETLLMSGLNQCGIHNSDQASQYTAMLSHLLFNLEKDNQDNPLFNMNFAQGYPLIGAGAPAHCYFPAAAKKLAMELDLPQHAEVANAVGAVTGQVVQNARISITQPIQGLYRVHGEQGIKDFDKLPHAYELAEELAREKAHSLALSAGANTPDITITRDENSVDHDIDGFVFFEATVIASAVGQPVLS